MTKNKTNYVSLKVKVNYRGEKREDKAGVISTDLLCFSSTWSKVKDKNGNDNPGFDIFCVKMINQSAQVTNAVTGKIIEKHATEVVYENLNSNARKIEKGTYLIVEGYFSKPSYFISKKTGEVNTRLELTATKVTVLDEQDNTKLF